MNSDAPARPTGPAFATASAPASASLANATARAASPDDADTFELAGLQSKFAALAERVSPSVVAISASCSPNDSDAAVRSPDLNPQKIDGLIGSATRTVGTGFFIDADGFILTNQHVVADAEQLWVTTDDRRVLPAMVIGTDPRADLAVIKVPLTGAPPVRFADPARLKRGDWAVAVGNPYGFAAEGEMAFSVGVVSAVDRSLPKLSAREKRNYAHLLQVTTPINPGSSGGPLFNLAGEVVGVNAAVIMPNKQFNGIGFAIPVSADTVARVGELRRGREVIYAYLGVVVAPPTQAELRSARVAGAAKIDSTEADSPAAEAGLTAGDLVTAFGGQAVRDADAFSAMIAAGTVGSRLDVTIVRGGKPLTLQITPARRPMPAVAVTRESQRLRFAGLTVGCLPANWGAARGTRAPRPGVYVVSVAADSPYAKQGLRPGSVITAVAGQAVAGLTDLQQLIDQTPASQCQVTTADDAPAAAVVSASR